VPGEERLRQSLSREVFPDKCFQQFLAHNRVLHPGVKFALCEVIAVIACKVTDSAHRFQHHVDRPGERCDGRLSVQVFFILLFNLSIRDLISSAC
jgi:hypothetical protein